MTRVACAAIAFLLLPSPPLAAEEPAAEGTDAAEKRDATKEFDVGHFYVGAAYSFGVGSAFFHGKNIPMQELGIGGGLAVGFRMPTSRLWWELGLTAGPFRDTSTLNQAPTPYEMDSPDPEAQALNRVFGGVMPLHLEMRLLVPVKAPHAYWASSILPGVLMTQYIRYDADDPYGDTERKTVAPFSMILRTGLAFVLGDWVEIRLDVLGMELIFEDVFCVLYSPSFAIVLRI